MPQLTEAKWTDALKAAYHTIHPENFADGQDFPIKDASDVGDAWGLAGHADNPDAVRRKIISIARRLGFVDALPDTAKAFMAGKKEQAATTPTIEESAAITSGVRPRKKIATIRVCYLEYNARSLNGRIYPQTTCDAIHASLLRKIADPASLPMTCFVSHEAANGNVNTQLVGRIVGGVQEGNKFYADIDIADTSVARDQLALIEGNYMQSESMRVVGVELQHDRSYDLPLVVPQMGAEQVELMGIDLTTRPGLTDTARIQQILYESEGNAPYSESFSLNTVSTIAKEALVSVPYYLQVIAESGDLPNPKKRGLSEARKSAARKACEAAHDHLAGVLDATVKDGAHGTESARLVSEAALDEAGAAIAKKHAVKLAAAHDAVAEAAGMDCSGCYNDELGIDPDSDGDGDGIPDDLDPQDDGEESATSRKGAKTSVKEDSTKKPLSESEMIAALKAQGYDIPAKKTREQVLQESVDAKLAALESKVTASIDAALVGLKSTIEAATAQPTERQTQTKSAFEESALVREDIYKHGDYLKGTLVPSNWRNLADPLVPWPADLDPELALMEMAPFMSYAILNIQEVARGRNLHDAIDAGLYS